MLGFGSMRRDLRGGELRTLEERLRLDQTDIRVDSPLFD
jgi:hypothetical protein